MLLDNLAKLSRSSRNALSAALFIIAAIAIYNWMVAPHATYLFAAQQYESVIDSVARKNRILSNTINVKKKKLKELRERFSQLQSTLFIADEAKEFLSDLRVICEGTGCIVHSLNFTTGESDSQQSQFEDASGVITNSAMLSVTGVYSNIIELVEILQKRTQKVWIDSIEMTALDEDSAKLKCDMAITISTIHDKGITVNE